MKSKEEREEQWRRACEDWRNKQAKFESEHDHILTVDINKYCVCPDKATEDIYNWIGGLSTKERSVLSSLVLQRGTYSENQILADWIVEHDGRLWFRWALVAHYIWVKK